VINSHRFQGMQLKLLWSHTVNESTCGDVQSSSKKGSHGLFAHTGNNNIVIRLKNMQRLVVMTASECERSKWCLLLSRWNSRKNVC